MNTRRIGAYYGIVIDSQTDPLSNLRFADDVLLFASNPSDIGKMLDDLGKEASKFGLKIHMGKTVVLSNRLANRPEVVKCGNAHVKVASPEATEKYLGRKVSITDFHQVEFENRMASAWGAFFKFKASLCNRHVSLKHRLKLFESCVTPCALYASGTWTVTVEMQHKLSTTRRKMLRWIVAVPRHRDEEWVHYIQRATHRSEELATRHGHVDWVALSRERKWTLAGRAARSEDGRWMHRILSWRPWFRAVPHRCVGRPLKRWEDDLVTLAGGSWPDAARDTAIWDAAASAYINRPY